MPFDKLRMTLLRQAQTDNCFHNWHFIVHCNAELVRVLLQNNMTLTNPV